MVADTGWGEHQPSGGKIRSRQASTKANKQEAREKAVGRTRPRKNSRSSGQDGELLVSTFGWDFHVDRHKRLFTGKLEFSPDVSVVTKNGKQREKPNLIEVELTLSIVGETKSNTGKDLRNVPTAVLTVLSTRELLEPSDQVSLFLQNAKPKPARTTTTVAATKTPKKTRKV